MNSFSEGGIPVEDFENGRSPSTPVKSVVSSSSTGLSPSPLKPSQKPNRMDETVVTSPSRWDHIRDLDEDEKWYERTEVVTKGEHQFHMQCAKEFVDEIVSASTSSDASRHSGETAVAGMQADAEYQYMDNFTDEDFKGSAAQLDIEYLEKIAETQSGNFTESALARQSLYVKFDPLVGGNSPKRHLQGAALRPKAGVDLLMMDTPPPEHVKHNKTPRAGPRVTFASPKAKDLLTHSPHMMARDGDAFGGRESMESASEADNSTSGFNSSHSSPQKEDPSPTEELVKVLKYSEADVARIVEAALAKEREKLASLEERHQGQQSAIVCKLQMEKEKHRTHASLVLGEREMHGKETDEWKAQAGKTDELAASHKGKYEEQKNQIEQLQQTRDQALADFESMEKAFSDLHTRYFKLKELTQALKKRENHYKETCAGLEATVREGDTRMASLVAEYEAKQAEVNQMVHKMEGDHASSITVMKTQAKKMSMEVESLKKALEQKEIEKGELASICDELVKEIHKRQK